MAEPNSQMNTRERLIRAMSHSLQQRGFHGIGLNAILSQAEAPKGVLYHHFPGGKTDLAVAAIEASVVYIRASLNKLIATAAGNPGEALKAWLSIAQKQLQASAFEKGCPLATVALESTADDQRLRQALAEGFEEIRKLLGEILAPQLESQERAHRLATLIVSAYEGALMQSRVANSIKPLQDTTDMLLELVDPIIRRNPS